MLIFEVGVTKLKHYTSYAKLFKEEKCWDE